MLSKLSIEGLEGCLMRIHQLGEQQQVYSEGAFRSTNGLLQQVAAHNIVPTLDPVSVPCRSFHCAIATCSNILLKEFFNWHSTLCGWQSTG